MKIKQSINISHDGCVNLALPGCQAHCRNWTCGYFLRNKWIKYMILNDETEFCNKYARSSNGEMDVIPFREVSWRNYRWTHFGEFLQSLHHILILLSSEKCYSSQGVFEFLFHIHVVHWINTISWNNVTESTLHEEVHLDFPLWSNPDVHTMIFLKYMDRLFSKYMDRQYKRNTLIFALQRAVGISCWYQVVLMQGARPLLPPRMF